MFCSRQPCAALADAVQTLWAVDVAHDHLELRLPTASPQLLIRLRTDRLSWRGEGDWQHIGGDGISGPFAQALTLDASQQDGVLGVVFRPGGLAAFTAEPMEALVGRHAPLAAVMPQVDWGRELARVRGLPLALGLVALEHALVRARAARLDPPVTRALELLDRGARVGSVADALGWSQGRLVRTFRRTVGLKPKRFARLGRMRRAVAAIAAGEDLSFVAYAHGYTDQAHLAHDLVELVGVTPTAWRDGPHTYATHLRL